MSQRFSARLAAPCAMPFQPALRPHFPPYPALPAQADAVARRSGQPANWHACVAAALLPFPAWRIKRQPPAQAHLLTCFVIVALHRRLGFMWFMKPSGNTSASCSSKQKIRGLSDTTYTPAAIFAVNKSMSLKTVLTLLSKWVN